jgi:hypothetical protein
VFCLHVRDTSLLGEDQCPRDHVEYMEDDYDMDDATDNTCDGHHERGIRPELRFEGCKSSEVILRKNLGKCERTWCLPLSNTFLHSNIQHCPCILFC